MATEKDIWKCYDLNNIENYVKSLSGYGEIDKLSGEFKFNQCE